jgi:hypothetical protein
MELLPILSLERKNREESREEERVEKKTGQELHARGHALLSRPGI